MSRTSAVCVLFTYSVRPAQRWAARHPASLCKACPSYCISLEIFLNKLGVCLRVPFLNRSNDNDENNTACRGMPSQLEHHSGSLPPLVCMCTLPLHMQASSMRQARRHHCCAVAA